MRHELINTLFGGSSARKSIRNEVLKVFKSNDEIETVKLRELRLSKGDQVKADRRTQQFHVRVDFAVNLLLEKTAENTTLDDVESLIKTSFSTIAIGSISLQASFSLIIFERTQKKIENFICKQNIFFQEIPKSMHSSIYIFLVFFE